MALAALAIFLLAVAAFPQTAFAGTSNPDKGRSESSTGHERKAEVTAAAASDSQPSAGTPTAADNPEDYSNHDATNGPGGQVCDGDPNNAPGAGGNYENTCPAGPSQNGAGDGQANGKPCAGCVGNADDKNPPGQATSGPTDSNNGYECDQKGRSANEGNNGVGYGNPAHTGCQPDVTETCPDGSPMPASGDCTPKCPDGKPMPANGDCTPKCPDGKPMPANGDCTPKCPDGSTMPANGKCGGDTCPDGSAMPANGKCGGDTPCVPSSTTVCGQETPSCVASASANRCGGGEVLGETLGRPVEVLGVQLTAPAAEAAPAALAFTGSQLLGLTGLGAVLAFLGLLLVLATRRRRSAAIVE
jgi:hypothetical protein